MATARVLPWPVVATKPQSKESMRRPESFDSCRCAFHPSPPQPGLCHTRRSSAHCDEPCFNADGPTLDADLRAEADDVDLSTLRVKELKVRLAPKVNLLGSRLACRRLLPYLSRHAVLHYTHILEKQQYI